MRYFRYKGTAKVENQALKVQYKSLSDLEKRNVRRKKRWCTFTTVVTMLLILLFIVGIGWLLAWIPEPDPLFWNILTLIGKVILGCVLFLICFALSVICTSPLWNKVESFQLPSRRKEFLFQACAHLREYYGIQDTYIVTKCFDSTDRRFKNHDVCIFVFGDELRITTDLVRGFIHDEKDLGCYAFRKDEIRISKRINEERLILELSAGEIVFQLGYRAKRFIEDNILNI